MTDLPELTDEEKAVFDGMLQRAVYNFERSGHRKSLQLRRMLLDGKPVAVIGFNVFNRFSDKREGWLPLAVVLTREDIPRLADPDGQGGVTFSPNDLDTT